MKDRIKKSLREATTSSAIGKFKVPIVLAPQPWTETQLGPFTDRVSPYINAELAYEDYDDDYKEPIEKRIEIEKKTRKVAKIDAYLKQFYTGQNDEEGSNIADIDSPDDVISKVSGPLRENNFLKEDLAVWFGTKKKPKGSKQPKGPWVNICRKDKNGKHPPCGRPEAQSKGYPKCRAVHVASKMSSSQKRAACQQKRTAEKKNPKIGTGNKPTMVSYQPKNESKNFLIKKLIREIYEPEKLYTVENIYSKLPNTPFEVKKMVAELIPIPCVNRNDRQKKMCFKISEELYNYFFEKN